MSPCRRLIIDADGLRASEIEHSVEHLGGDRDLGGLGSIGVEAQGVANDLLPAPDLALDASKSDPLEPTYKVAWAVSDRINPQSIGA